MKLMRIYILGLLGILALLLSGCETTDTGSPDASQGKIQKVNYRQDSRGLWREFRWHTDLQVKLETKGKPAPSLGGGPWDEFWLSMLRGNDPWRQENFQKYHDYILNERRQAGLDELDTVLEVKNDTIVYKDTEANFRIFKFKLDFLLFDEKESLESDPSSKPSWDLFWEDFMSCYSAGMQENPSRYREYFESIRQSKDLKFSNDNN